jgi:nitrite reductase/ring-hydroxylating ferredoxin subunit
VEHEGRGIVVIRKETSIHAYDDVCPHAGWRLSEGEIMGDMLECPGHGWQFALGSGRCQEVPFYTLKPIQVLVRGDVVRLEWAEGPGGLDGPASV